jgi:hypothetical protein
MDNADAVKEIVQRRHGEFQASARPLTNPEKAFWKDAFLACAKSTLLRDNSSSPEATADLCGNFADAAMDAYRSRSITWRKS